MIEADAGLGVGHELLGVGGGGVLAVAGALEHRRAVEPVAERGGPTDADRLEDRARTQPSVRP